MQGPQSCRGGRHADAGGRARAMAPCHRREEGLSGSRIRACAFALLRGVSVDTVCVIICCPADRRNNLQVVRARSCGRGGRSRLLSSFAPPVQHEEGCGDQMCVEAPNVNKVWRRGPPRISRWVAITASQTWAWQCRCGRGRLCLEQETKVCGNAMPHCVPRR